MASASSSKLFRHIALRLFYGIISLIFLSLVTFLIDEVAPGDAALVKAGEKATVQQIERIRHEMGLDRPWPVRYVEYVGNAVQGDFGTSYYGAQEPVRKILGNALQMTLMLAIPSILLATFLGLVLGTLASINRNNWLDQAILAFSTMGVTLPNFVLAPLLVLFLAVRSDFLPTSWETPLQGPLWTYLAIPVVVMAARPTATLTRLTRASMIDVLGQEFIKLAQAKGVPKWRLYIRHALRNAVLPVVTAMGTSFGFLLTGSFIVETIFIMPGMGYTAIDAIQQNDTPVVLACVMLTGFLFILANLIVDLVQPFMDPRIREAQV